MNDFDTAAHPRATDGTFATKPRVEADLDLDSIPDFSAVAADDKEAERRQEVHELGGGVWEVRSVLRDGVRHPDLKAIYEQADRISSNSGPTREELLAGYDELDASLVAFRETARVAYVARDRAAARGTLDPAVSDPTSAYGAHDWRTASEALTELRKVRAKAVGQVTRTYFDMFTPEANAAVRAEMDTLAARIDAGVLSPGEVKLAIHAHVKAIASRYPEVNDTEPEWAIVDTLNPLLERRGYREITREDLW